MVIPQVFDSGLLPEDVRQGRQASEPHPRPIPDNSSRELRIHRTHYVAITKSLVAGLFPLHFPLNTLWIRRNVLAFALENAHLQF